MSIDSIRNLLIGRPRDAEAGRPVGRMGGREVRQLIADDFGSIINKIIEFISWLFGLNDDQGSALVSSKDADAQAKKMFASDEEAPVARFTVPLVQDGGQLEVREVDLGRADSLRVTSIDTSPPVARMEEVDIDHAERPPANPFFTRFNMFVNMLKIQVPNTNIEVNPNTGDFIIAFPQHLNAKIGKLKAPGAIHMAEGVTLSIEKELTGKVDLKTGVVKLNGKGIIATKELWGTWTITVKEFKILNEGDFQFTAKVGFFSKSATFSVNQMIDTLQDVQWEGIKMPAHSKATMLPLAPETAEKASTSTGSLVRREIDPKDGPLDIPQSRPKVLAPIEVPASPPSSLLNRVTTFVTDHKVLTAGSVTAMTLTAVATGAYYLGISLI